MNRRNFIKVGSMGMAAFLLSGCGVRTTAEETAAASSVQGFIPSVASGQTMKITVITGSPHEKGTSALLADQFIKGAEQIAMRFFVLTLRLKNFIPALAVAIAVRMGLVYKKMQ